MSELTASALHRAIDTCKLRVCAASTTFGQFPAIFIMIGGRQVARIGSQFHDAPTAVAQGLNVHINGSPGVRASMDIKCKDIEESTLIACVLDSRFRVVTTAMYADRNCLFEKSRIAKV